MRSISEIAHEINRVWGEPIYFAAAPYLHAMRQLRDASDYYMSDPAPMVVAYFLGNARGFKGPEARRLKAELKEIIGQKLTKPEREALQAWRNAS